MRIVFWNVQRIGNPFAKSSDSMARFGLFWAYLVEIAQKADLIILCEISQKGEELAAEITKELKFHAVYVPVLGSSGGVSPCGFLVAAKASKPTVLPVGTASQRPAIKITGVGRTVYACHIIAIQGPPAEDEIMDFVTEIDNNAVLIGDMNYGWNKWTLKQHAYNTQLIGQMDLKIVPPLLPFTHKSQSNGSTSPIDYAFAPKGGVCNPTNAVAKYDDFDTIDHAPIAYDI